MEIFLLALLNGLAERARWGTEADIVTAIDWPAKPGGTAEQGRVTVRIDSNGAASAQLIARGAVPAVSQTTTATALQTGYKLAAVTDDGTARWSASDLNNVGAALAILPPGDRQVLEEVELIRVSAIPGKPNDAGQFEFPNPAASDASAVNIHGKLRLANRAFSNDTVQFFGGTAKTVPSSFQTILHEVGHAVESEVYRSKWKAHAKALAETKAAGNVPESDKRKAERAAIEEKMTKAKSASAKGRLENKLTEFDLELAKRSEEATDKKAAETKLKDKETEVTTLDAAGESARLKKFLALVASKRIRPFTAYARTGNAEFYAEAYSLWLVDPDFLSANYSDIYNFFQNGDYRR